MSKNTGVPASPSGSRASHGAAEASPPEASIPNADELRRRAITEWWRGQALREFIKRVRAAVPKGDADA